MKTNFTALTNAIIIGFVICFLVSLSPVIKAQSASGGSYYTDFSEISDLDSWDGNDFRIEDENLMFTGIASARYMDSLYTNCMIETKITGNIRILFRTGENVWLDPRYFVEPQFGGNLSVRDGDAKVAECDIPPLMVGEYQYFKIKIFESNIEIYINDADTAALTFDDLEVREGLVGLMSINFNDTQIGDFKITWLDSAGNPAGVTDIENAVITNMEWNVYPNPVVEKLTIRKNSGDSNYNKNVQAHIIQLCGSVVMKTLLDDNISSIDVSGLPRGVYLLKIVDNKKTSVMKFIKH